MTNHPYKTIWQRLFSESLARWHCICALFGRQQCETCGNPWLYTTSFKAMSEARKHISRVPHTGGLLAWCITCHDPNPVIRFFTTIHKGYMPKPVGKKKDSNKEESIEVEGTVDEALRNAIFKVKLDTEAKTTILCHISGRMRMNNIKILPGDKVAVEMSPYDLTQGRITYRYKS